MKNKSKKYIKAIKWQKISIIVNIILQLTLLTTTARILKPDDFGVMTIAGVIMSLTLMITQMGTNQTIVKTNHCTNELIRASFSINIILALGASIILIVYASDIAKIFGINELSKILVIISIVIFINSISSTSEGLLAKEFKFKEIVLTEMIALGLGNVLITIILVKVGFGVVSMAYGLLFQSIIRGSILYFINRHPVTPCIRKNEVKEIIYFGGGFTLARIFNYGSTNGDNMILSLKSTPEILGLYSKSYQIMMMPVFAIGSSIEKLLFPMLSELSECKNEMGRIYLQTSAIIALVMAPISAFMIVNAENIILLILGKSWLSAVETLQILSFAVLFRTVYKVGDSVAKASGAVYLRSIRELIYLSMVISGTYYGLSYGANGVSCAITIAVIINFMITAIMSSKILILNMVDTFKIYTHPIVLFLTTIVITSITDALMVDMIGMHVFFLKLIVTVLGLLLLIYTYPKMIGIDNIKLIVRLMERASGLENNVLLTHILRRLKYLE